MIRLERTIRVRMFEIQATVAVGRKRPEFLAVARLAADLGRPLSGEDVDRELLGVSAKVGWRVIDRCVALGLLERAGERGPAKLTQSGHLALEHEQVLVPEEGVFRLYLADDPLLDEPLLHCERLDVPPADDEREELRRGKWEKRGRPELGTPPPRALGEARGRMWRSVCGGQGIEIRELGPYGRRAGEHELRLELTWEPTGSPRVHLEGSLPRPREDDGSMPVSLLCDAPHACSEYSYDSLWILLVAMAGNLDETLLETWRQRTGHLVLPRRFAAVGESARRQMSQELAIPECTIESLGSFEPTYLDDVAIVPASDADAQQWCEWLQWDALHDYVTPEDVRHQAQAVHARFRHHSPRPLGLEGLLERAIQTRGDRRAWYVLAPADLGLWRVS